MDKENVVFMYSGTLIGLLKKAILMFVTTWLNPEDIMLHEIGNHRTDAVWFFSYEVSKIAKLTECWLPRLGRGQNEEFLLNRCRISVTQDE